ncbi:MAG TPA: trehalose-6-phosphate synthase [Acidimicrobiia bacterium]|nr:trehalose-6-phosphate synthase [Acidimicrobiia bacterium]
MDQPLVVVANRLPVRREEDGSWAPSPGGLVTALTPILQRGGTWIGWAGVGKGPSESFRINNIDHVAVSVSDAEIDDYYLGFCNGTLWPLFHDGIRAPEYHRRWWNAYQRVNQRYAEAVLEHANPGDLIWVHDYHLLLLPQMLREASPDFEIRFFLHIPFPPVELYARLPWRRQLIEGMLAADVIGFQTESSTANFRKAADVFAGAEVQDRLVRIGSRSIRTMAAPISVDFDSYNDVAGTPRIDERVLSVRDELGNPDHIFLGADRLDYTKGIDVRLRAFATLLRQNPHLADKSKLVQIVVPSRQTIGEYSDMREEIERLAGRINSVHGGRHRMPVHYTYESLEREELVAYYKAADVMVVTPLVDGMNLVAKEFVASRVDEDGVLLLSEFAGAAHELPAAVLVNPYDIDGVALAMRQAIELEPAERLRRMREMRNTVRENDLEAWTRRILDPDLAAISA